MRAPPPPLEERSLMKGSASIVRTAWRKCSFESPAFASRVLSTLRLFLLPRWADQQSSASTLEGATRSSMK